MGGVWIRKGGSPGREGQKREGREGGDLFELRMSLRLGLQKAAGEAAAATKALYASLQPARISNYDSTGEEDEVCCLLGNGRGGGAGVRPLKGGREGQPLV